MGQVCGVGRGLRWKIKQNKSKFLALSMLGSKLFDTPSYNVHFQQTDCTQIGNNLSFEIAPSVFIFNDYSETKMGWTEFPCLWFDFNVTSDLSLDNKYIRHKQYLNTCNHKHSCAGNNNYQGRPVPPCPEVIKKLHAQLSWAWNFCCS